ncbi:MAG TPA: DNA mismatch repair protein MutS [Deltaproteobacteria bacterium]|nr:DNA mismatch repair protein MutS [Deltaproteobacteria bacterium]
MKPSEPSDKIKSFQELKNLLDSESVSLRSYTPEDIIEEPDEKPATDPDIEKQLFLDAVADVTPLPEATRVSGKTSDKLPKADEVDPDSEVMDQLENLVKYGSGFVVSSTPEYIEGTGYRVNPNITRRLHQGEFSIQEHIDLHGMSVESAKEAFEAFLKNALLTGKRAVLIVHGRGLSSPAKPVLKTKVYEWLTSGPWRKWVMAFSSARLCDGGAGATYVLMRNRPLTKRYRKKK